jgi:hypothetical protein
MIHVENIVIKTITARKATILVSKKKSKDSIVTTL